MGFRRAAWVLQCFIRPSRVSQGCIGISKLALRLVFAELAVKPKTFCGYIMYADLTLLRCSRYLPV